LGPETTD